MAVKANVKAIEAIRPRADRYDQTVTGRPGLVIRIWPSGKISVFHRYKFAGQSFKTMLGEYPATPLADLLAKHEQQRQQLSRNENPAAIAQATQQRETNDPTISQLAELYLERHARPNKRSAKQDELMLEKDVVKRWGKLRARTITRANVIAMVDAIIDRGAQTQARKTLAVVKRMFGFALSRDIVETDPTVRVSVKAAAPRDRSLSDTEIGIVWNALSRTQMPKSMCDCIRLQLLTGQRIGEICGLERQELDIDTAVWRLPSERSKTKKGNLIPLTGAAIAILRHYMGTEPRSKHVFISFSKAGHLLPGSIVHALNRSLDIFKDADGKKILPFTTHDLRRTTATGLASLGVPRLIVDRILNHADHSVTGRHYDTHAYLEEMRSALEAWARKLDQITKGKSSTVTPLRRSVRHQRRG